MPAKDRYLLVNAFYRGGSSVIDFSDPTAPKEIAFADMEGTNTWSAYTYPRKSGRRNTIPVYSNDGLSRNYARPTTPPSPAEYREAAYGFQRFEADVGRTKLVGFDRLNPQLQERVIPTKVARPRSDGDDDDKARTYAQGTPAAKGASNRSARHFTK